MAARRTAPRSEAGSAAVRARPVSRPRGRPPVISQERLLEIAREVFLELGFRATTAEVASRAGVAEGTIFLRFKSKSELFRAAMQFDPDQALEFVEALPARAGAPDLRAVLIDFAEQFIRVGRVALPVMMMTWSNPEQASCLERGSERGLRYRRVIAALTRFFALEFESGRLVAGDPEVLARMFMGSFHHFVMGEVFAGVPVGTLSAAEFAEEVVDVLLRSAAVVAPARAPSRRRKPA
ncbi:MAG TPA: TetR/AcrR family transcriptional regulator [Polyangiaceae bacterium]|nr:TetR/AcrR family transcriptional regulator [Polyangiaceae bacterium]